MDPTRMIGFVCLIVFPRVTLCSELGEKELRLVGGSSPCEGRVEVKHRGEWGTVCGLNWNKKNAAVVCRQMGCQYTDQDQVEAASFGAGSGPVWLSQVKCTGEESAVWDCQHRMWGSAKCMHRDDAGVICSGTPGETRLCGANKCEGRLEVKHKGQWGTVCGEKWKEKEAAVVCHQLGCNSSHEEPGLIQGTFFEPGSGKAWLSDVSCTAEESHQWQCKQHMGGKPFCDSSDVDVICAGEHEEIKLVDGKTKCDGRLMVKHRGQWGSVCSHSSWSMPETRVACKQLGCGRPLEHQIQDKATNANAASGKIWLSNLKCTGEEQSLMECDHNIRGSERCGHVEVICEPSDSGCNEDEKNVTTKAPDRRFRLVKGIDHCSGIVQRLCNTNWGPLCADKWSIEAAQVLCRELSCGPPPSETCYGLRNVMCPFSIFCNGREQKITECRETKYRKQPCTMGAAGVRCGAKDKTVRLANGPDQCGGKVEVFYDNVWNKVLNHGWGLNETNVVCKHLHCGHAVRWFGRTDHSNIPNIMVHCEGHESSLHKCSISRGFSYNMNRVEVLCSESRSVRLVGRGNRCAGVVEMNHRGKWVVISGDSWSLEDGAVACRELNCGHIITAETKTVHSNGEYWLNNVMCEGGESSLQYCSPESWKISDPGEKEAATVLCSEFTELRLMGGADNCEGHLVVYYNGTWGSVCSNQMSDTSLSVICKELNCGTNGHLESSLKYGEGPLPSLLDLVDCCIEDESLIECPSAWGVNDCTAEQVAQIKCEKSETST